MWKVITKDACQIMGEVYFSEVFYYWYSFVIKLGAFNKNMVYIQSSLTVMAFRWGFLVKQMFFVEETCTQPQSGYYYFLLPGISINGWPVFDNWFNWVEM